MNAVEIGSRSSLHYIITINLSGTTVLQNHFPSVPNRDSEIHEAQFLYEWQESVLL